MQSCPTPVAFKLQITKLPILPTPSPATAPHSPLPQTRTASLRDGPQSLCEISLRTRSSAWRPRRPEDKTFGPACSRTSTECCRCPSSILPRRVSESRFFPASPCLHDTEYTSRSFHGGKTSSSAKPISQCTTSPPTPPLPLSPA